MCGAMLCAVLCACVVTAISYSNVANTVAVQAREKQSVCGHSSTNAEVIKTSRAQPACLIAPTAFPAVFQEHYAR